MFVVTAVIAADTDKSSILGLPVNTLLIVAAISGATIVLALLIIVAGVICVKKYRYISCTYTLAHIFSLNSQLYTPTNIQFK